MPITRPTSKWAIVDAIRAQNFGPGTRVATRDLPGANIEVHAERFATAAAQLANEGLLREHPQPDGSVKYGLTPKGHKHWKTEQLSDNPLEWTAVQIGRLVIGFERLIEKGPAAAAARGKARDDRWAAEAAKESAINNAFSEPSPDLVAVHSAAILNGVLRLATVDAPFIHDNINNKVIDVFSDHFGGRILTAQELGDGLRNSIISAMNTARRPLTPSDKVEMANYYTNKAPKIFDAMTTGAAHERTVTDEASAAFIGETSQFLLRSDFAEQLVLNGQPSGVLTLQGRSGLFRDLSAATTRATSTRSDTFKEVNAAFVDIFTNANGGIRMTPDRLSQRLIDSLGEAIDQVGSVSTKLRVELVDFYAKRAEAIFGATVGDVQPDRSLSAAAATTFRETVGALETPTNTPAQTL